MSHFSNFTDDDNKAILVYLRYESLMNYNGHDVLEFRKYFGFD